MNKIQILALMLVLFNCNIGTSQISTKTYTVSNEDFVNPERGFYRYSETRSSNYTPLNESTLVAYRSLHQPFSASYSIYSSLSFRYFFLEDFKNSDISQAYLDLMQADFDVARDAGIKLIPRFAYTDIATSCGNTFCTPYGDAPKSIVLGHIAQLKPILQANKDVILSLQIGFIGIWGENYYTDYFGDASQGPLFGLTEANWNDRNEITAALLDALPEDRMLQLRYPQAKQKFLFGADAPTSSAPMTSGEAFTTADVARLGMHNDCFLSSFNDIGTYIDYSNSSTSDTATLKPYLAADSKYTIMGGETCSDYDPWSECTQLGGMAQAEMARFHYTYLNADYNNALNNDWEGTCIDEIKKNLGYRIHLLESSVANVAAQNGCLALSFSIENTGYASPVNPRKVALILRNHATAKEWSVDLEVDARKWYTGTHVVVADVRIPSCVEIGSYALYIHLADPEPLLTDRPEYAIRLANEGLWETATGYNDLQQSVSVVATEGGTCTSILKLTKREGANRWIGNSGESWESATANWSLGSIPDPCDQIVIPAGKVVIIPDGVTALGYSLKLESGAQLITQGSGSINLVIDY